MLRSRDLWIFLVSKQVSDESREGGGFGKLKYVVGQLGSLWSRSSKQ